MSTYIVETVSAGVSVPAAIAGRLLQRWLRDALCERRQMWKLKRRRFHYRTVMVLMPIEPAYHGAPGEEAFFVYRH
ncbi:hypothetical protein AB3X96_29585 [Paraburkholderia sp. BR13439]|uniref:hypothetical protein n=1 Tax=Paraburkholderia TaxID=1822464 RepID=UPI0034CE9C1B